jgi:hypothetical protein
MGLLRRGQNEYSAGVLHGETVTLTAQKVLSHQFAAA